MKKFFTSVLFIALALTASAQLAYNQAFTESDFNNASTVVKKQGNCSFTSNGITIGDALGGGFNWDEKYVDICIEDGFSSSVSFSYSTSANIPTGVSWYVKESTNGSDWSSSIWSATNKSGNVNVSLSKNTHYIRVSWSGNFAGYVKNLTVSGTKAVITYGDVAATVCQSELPYLFNGQEFTESGDVTLPKANIFGLDSVISLTLNVLPTYNNEDEPFSIYAGAAATWHSMDLSAYAVGTYTLVDSLLAITGCDSIWSVSLTVEEVPVAYGSYEAFFCPGDSIQFNDVWYTEAGVYENILLSEKNVLGGDSLLTLSITLYDVYTFQEEDITLVETVDSLWHGQDLSVLEEGEYVLYDSLSTVNGCDSVIYVNVIINRESPIDPDGPATTLSQTTIKPAAVKLFRNGFLYIRRDDALFDPSGRRVE